MELLKDKLTNVIKEYWRLIAILSFCCVVIFFHFLFQGKTFEMMNDQKFQGTLYYSEWVRLLKDFVRDGQWPFYSWYNFLGTDYFTTKMFYCNSDIFVAILFIFVVLMHKSVEYSMLIITILMVLICGITMKMYLNKLGIKNKLVSDIVSVIFALSGVMSLYFCNYHFSRFYCFLPLLFVGVEYYIRDNKKVPFILACFLLFFQDYYYMFPTSFFLVGYYIASYYSKKKDTIINVLLSALPLIGCYLISVLMAGIVLVPTIFYILQNSRVGAGTGGILFKPEIYLTIIERLFVPPYYVNNGLPKIFFDGTDGGHISWSSIYATALVPLSLLSFKTFKNHKESWPFYVCYLVYFICFLIRPLNSIIHGFSNVTFRWSFLLIFNGLILAVYLLDSDLLEKSINKIYTCFIGLIVIFSVILCFTGNVNFKTAWPALLIFLLAMVLGYLYIFLISKKNYTALMILICIELIAGNTFICRYNSSDFFYYEDSINEEYVEYFLTKNPDNYLRRIYIDSHYIMPAGELNQNNSLKYHYMGTMCYDSTYEYVLNPFLEYIGLADRQIDRIIDISDPEILRLIAARYIGVYSEDQLPEYSQGYTYAFDLDAIHMYELNGYNSIGHTYSKFVKASEFDSNNIDWNDTLIVNDEDFDKISGIKANDKKQLNIVEYANNYFQGKIDIDEKCVLFVSIPYSKGWKVNDQNGNYLETFNVEGGFTGIVLEPGNYTLYFNFTSPDFKKGALVSIAGCAAMFAVCVFEKYKKKNKI